MTARVPDSVPHLPAIDQGDCDARSLVANANLPALFQDGDDRPPRDPARTRRPASSRCPRTPRMLRRALLRERRGDAQGDL